MQNLAKVLGVLFLIVAGVFGYFLQKSNWDFTLAKSMVGYELNKLMGDKSQLAPVDVIPTDTDSKASDTPATEPESDPQPSKPAHSKDSIYEGKGNSFSDMKRTGGESTYEPKHKR